MVELVLDIMKNLTLTVPYLQGKIIWHRWSKSVVLVNGHVECNFSMILSLSEKISTIIFRWKLLNPSCIVDSVKIVKSIKKLLNTSNIVESALDVMQNLALNCAFSTMTNHLALMVEKCFYCDKTC